MVSKMQAHIKATPVLNCQQCGAPMERQRFSNGRLMDLGQFMKRKFCSKACQSASFVKDEVTSGSHRHRARKSRQECCELCSSRENLQVHHKDRNVENNASSNLQTLCASCHNKEHWKDRRANGGSN